MITGHNTDVRYGDVVLHVQTEDKGVHNPCIESLIYYGGQVVVAKRGSYSELLDSGKGEDEIMALMDHQHRTMIKAIQAGKFDERIRAFIPAQAKMPERDSPDSATTFDMSADSGRTLDQVILEYLTSEAEQEQLLLVLEGEPGIGSGANVDLALRTRSSRSGQPVAGAKIVIKMITTFGGPRTLGLGETNGEGLLHLPIQIPRVDRGTAALIITAASQIGQAELKHLL
ncbi:MAG: hypothetical protein MI919_34245 [Holophagales bacterium]|nr:hypothetical protein [Holophagales bacterium]